MWNRVGLCDFRHSDVEIGAEMGPEGVKRVVNILLIRKVAAAAPCHAATQNQHFT